MKKLTLLFALTLFLPALALCEEAIFSKEVLKKWGYESSSVNWIKSIKNYGDKNEAFYARFFLSKKCFDSNDMASNEASKAEKARLSDLRKYDKDYTRMIVSKNCIYSVRATSNYTHLEHQANLMKLIQEHLAK